MSLSIFSFPNKIIFGVGTINALSEQLSAFSPHKVLLVTDKGIRQVGLANEVTQRLEAARIDYAIFDGVHGNPVEEDVFNGANVFQQEGCDFVIGMGGGSPPRCRQTDLLKGNPPTAAGGIRNPQRRIGENFVRSSINACYSNRRGDRE